MRTCTATATKHARNDACALASPQGERVSWQATAANADAAVLQASFGLLEQLHPAGWEASRCRKQHIDGYHLGPRLTSNASKAGREAAALVGGLSY